MTPLPKPAAGASVAGRTPPPAPPHQVDAALGRVPSLSPRELEVFRLLPAGPSNRDISRRLLISEHTVKSHISRIIAKLRLDSRLQACLVATAHEFTNHSEG